MRLEAGRSGPDVGRAFLLRQLGEALTVAQVHVPVGIESARHGRNMHRCLRPC